MERSPIIRGRKSELYRINGRIEALKNGHGGTLLIEGERGSGKTTLVESSLSRMKGLNLIRVDFLPDRKNVPLSGFYGIPGVKETLLSDKEAFFGEIFLINNYGILIAHESNIESEMDEDILGSMLTAVQDFVKDSFGGEGGLGKLEYGEKKILIEHGKTAFMAALIVGDEHPMMRRDMIKTLAEIEDKMGNMFLDWDGEVEKIAAAIPILRKLTEKRYLVRTSLEDINLETEQTKVLERLRKLIEKSEPAIIVMEDVHWADGFSLRALGYLSRNLEKSLIIGTYRKSDMERGSEEMLASLEAERLSLSPLKEEDIREIISDMCPKNEFSEKFIKRIAEDSGGNPFYVEEIVTSLREDGLIYLEEGVWKNSNDEPGLPKSVSELISWRLDHLERNELNLAELLATAVSADIETLSEALGIDGDFLTETLSSLKEKNIVRVDGEKVRFYHSGVREVVYSEMSQRWRLSTHKKLGEVIEERTGGEGDSIYALAYHFSRSLDRAKGVSYSYLAGERAGASYAAHEAIGYYEVALSIIEGYLPSHSYRTEILERLGDLYAHVGEYDKALRSLENALKECAAPRRIYRKMADIYRKTGKYDDAVENCEKGMKAEGDALEAGKIKAIIGTICLRKGEMEKAMDSYEEYLRTARESGNPEEESAAYRAIGGLYFHGGQIEKAVEMWEKSMEVAEKAGDVERKAYALINLGVAYRTAGNLEDALTSQREALEIMKKTENIYVQAQILNNLGTIYYMLGRVEEQIAAWEESLKIKKRIGDIIGAAKIYNNLGSAYFEVRGYEKSVEYLEKSIEIFERMGDLRGLARGLCNLILSYSKLHKKNVMKTVEKASKLIEERDFGELLPNLYRARVMAMAASEGLEKAEKEFYEHVEEVRDRYGDIEQWIKMKLDFAELLLDEGEADKAKKEAEDVLTVAEKHGMVRYRTIAFDLLKRENVKK